MNTPNDPQLQAGPNEADAGMASAASPSLAPSPAPSNPVPSTLTSSQPSPQPQPQQPVPAIPAHIQEIAHHATFGKAVKSLMSSLNGTETQYRPNAQTGKIEEVQTPGKPGTFFKHLLMGALIGGAAGSSGDGAGGFFGGMGRGGTAALDDQRKQDEAKFKRAQEQLKGQQEQSKLTDEHNLHAAMVAHYSTEVAGLNMSQRFADQAHLDARNASSKAYGKALEDMGGVRTQFSIGGKVSDTISTADLAKEHQTNPSILQGPKGTHRIFVDITDASGMKWDEATTQWRNDSGQPVSPATQVSAYDLPTETLKTYHPRPGRELNTIAGQTIVDPDTTVNVNGEGMLSLATSRAKNDAQESRLVGANHKANETAKMNKSMVQIESKKAAALAKAEHAYTSGVIKNPDAKDDLLTELQNAKQAAQDGYESEITALKGSNKGIQHFNYGPTQPSTSPIPKTFNPNKWKTANPKGDVNAAILAAKRQGMQIAQ